MPTNKIILILAVLLHATSAHAGLVQTNGDFESYSVPERGDIAAIPVTPNNPNDWEYDDYYGYGKQPKLMNVSGIGNGEGGDVGVSFPNWEVDEGWKAALVQKGPVITAGTYELTTTFTGSDLKRRDNRNRIKVNMYWIEDLVDSWADEDKYGRLTDNDYVQLTSSDNGKWQTQTSRFVVEEGSAGDGKHFATWIQVKNYWGNIIVGEASLSQIASLTQVSVPEPGTVFLLMTGLLGLAMMRKGSSLR